MKLKSIAIFILALALSSVSSLSADNKIEEKVQQEDLTYDQLKKDAFSLARAGKPDEAINQINKVISEQPDSPWGYKLRGNIYFYMKNYEAALQDFEHVVRLRPQCANAFVDLSIAFLALGFLDAARENIERAIAIKPMSAFAYCVREKIYVEIAQSKSRKRG